MEKTNQPLDYMSITHFIVSFLFGYYNLFTFKQFLVLMFLWEIIEHEFAKTEFSKRFEKVYPIPRYLWQEILHNKINDIIINILGYYVGLKCRKK